MVGFKYLLSALAGFATAKAGVVLPDWTYVDAYILTQSPKSQAGILANIGPSGSKSQGAHSGVVIASPSTSDPNYLYTWIRDSSLVFKLLIDEYTLGLNPTLKTTITQWIASQGRLQQVTNPSGNITSGGLGEPKFNIDETAFTDGWGRPQRDGPALRAISMITYANYLISKGQTSTVTSTLWPIIKTDLDYVTTAWNQVGFDLWEEVNSYSFFTSSAHHRALRQGAALASVLHDTTRKSNYLTVADLVLCFLQQYWDSSKGYIISNLYIYGRSGLDSNSVLASIHGFDPEAQCDSNTFQPCSDKALANHYAYVNSFRSLYSLNSGIAAGRGVAVGRYSEDIYYDGNPWYLCTFAAAEQLFDALYTWNKIGKLDVTSISLPFFQQFSSSVTTGTYSKSSSTYKTLVKGVQQMADDFILINKKYTPSNGGLSEQFNKTTGVPTSAVDLTWSYASSLTAFQRAIGVVPKTWGASGLAPSSTTACLAYFATVSVTFNVNATTSWGEDIHLTGSVAALSNWNTNAPLMDSSNYPIWSLTVTLPASTHVEYKYIRLNNGQVTWESDPNNSLETPASGSVTVNDTWR